MKLRGYRVEPEEIELAARRLTGGAEVAVVPRTAGGVVVGLIGYLEGDQAVADGLNQALAAGPPRYLLTERWIAVPQLPRLASGKLHLAGLARWALPAGFAAGSTGPTASAQSADGADPLLASVLASFRTVLHRPELTPDADFFLSGGHSLLAANLVALIHRQAGIRPRLADVFAAPTARAVAERLRERGPAQASAAPIRRAEGNEHHGH